MCGHGPLSYGAAMSRLQELTGSSVCGCPRSAARPLVDLLLAAFFVAMTVAEQVTSPDPRTPWQLLAGAGRHEPRSPYDVSCRSRSPSWWSSATC